jgi:hypothetical protein
MPQAWNSGYDEVHSLALAPQPSSDVLDSSFLFSGMNSPLDMSSLELFHHYITVCNLFNTTHQPM